MLDTELTVETTVEVSDSIYNKKNFNHTVLFQTSGGRQEEEHQEEEGDQRRSIRGNGQGPRREGTKHSNKKIFFLFRESGQKLFVAKLEYTNRTVQIIGTFFVIIFIPNYI